MALTHSPSIARSGLVLHLDAANIKSYNTLTSTSTWYDLSGNGYNGTLVNSLPYNAANGGSFMCNGTTSSGYTSVANFTSITNIVTIGWWYNKIGASTGFSRIFDFVAGGDYLEIADNGGGLYYDFNQTNNSAYPWTSTGITLTTGQWGYYVWSFDGTTVLAYQNGVLKYTNVTASVGLTVPANQQLRIGFGGAINNEVINAYISNVTIYKRKLTDTEIQQNYQALRDRYNV